MTSHQMSTTSATQTPPPATSAGHGAGAGAGGAGSADGDAPRRTPSDELTDAFRRPALLPAFLLLVAAIVLLTRAADDFRMATRRDGRNIVASPPSYYPATSWAGDFVGRRGGEVAGGNRRRGGAGDERDDRVAPTAPGRVAPRAAPAGHGHRPGWIHVETTTMKLGTGGGGVTFGDI